MSWSSSPSQALGYVNKSTVRARFRRFEMTQEIFREEPYRAEAEASVARVDERGIVLDRTNFYPRGGGQAGDAGTLVRHDGAGIVIADTVKGEAPGEIVHVPAPGQEAALASLAAGESVSLRLDWARRHRG